MKKLDHIRHSDIDINEAVGETLRIFNNRRRKDQTVTFEDMQVIPVITLLTETVLYTVVLVLSYDDAVAETPRSTVKRWIGMPDQAEVEAVEESARPRFIGTDYSDS